MALAMHDGHDVRDELMPFMALTDAERLREEDPHTAVWSTVVPTRVVVHRSRFEVDMNRERDKAIYHTPADAWGLNVWREPPPRAMIDRTMAEYDEFYGAVGKLLDEKIDELGLVIVLDIHTYNHRRGGPDAPFDDPVANPDVNVGTGALDRDYFAPIVDRFIRDMSVEKVGGKVLDVRENVRFRGGHMTRWLCARRPRNVCPLALEFKKIFMNEWTGVPDPAAVEQIRVALSRTIPGLIEERNRLAEKAADAPRRRR
ncbi:MAG: N-formylglutamate amidohydrolase [Deltaproteobacteria bacterium]|nr:N-formylglutamate amidohydrolase [bacterium]MCB9475998.1 N-formylglutamate amidohydrolase [Deltaproteobacteria bacterium]MCB9480076.1 N-formylglutamate amidohydrolase [Deltaproteobacteria bacterium]MCB9487134.1 N-formylglutamate amidohydrolase [Deltaproteobacteria bacterium]